MSTRARIAFIVREEGYRLEYSKHWDGYHYAVLGSLPAGTFTIEDLIKRWELTIKTGPAPMKDGMKMSKVAQNASDSRTAQTLSQIGYSTGSKYIDSTPHLGHFAGGVAPSC